MGTETRASVYAETDSEALMKVADLEARGFSVEIVDMRTYKIIGKSRLGQPVPKRKPAAPDA
jgi:pyruvate/2-oxoglutarate/acetoin dehydrogenase E1 component